MRQLRRKNLSAKMNDIMKKHAISSVSNLTLWFNKVLQHYITFNNVLHIKGYIVTKLS